MHAAFSVRLFSLPLVLVGCNPEEEDNELLGCMDPDAVNFNPDATIDAGSCVTPCPQLGQEMPELKKKELKFIFFQKKSFFCYHTQFVP